VTAIDADPTGAVATWTTEPEPGAPVQRYRGRFAVRDDRIVDIEVDRVA
jgi:hypothetical protein